MGQPTKKVAIATLFGAVTFLTKTIVPSPTDKMFIVVHAMLLGLEALILKRFGATYVALIDGVQTALWRTAFALFTFLFALLYGIFVDTSFFLLKVNSEGEEIKTFRLVASLTLSTGLVGFLSYYVTVFVLGLLQRNVILEVSILVIGTVSGAIAGYFSSVIWNKHLKNVKH